MTVSEPKLVFRPDRKGSTPSKKISSTRTATTPVRSQQQQQRLGTNSVEDPQVNGRNTAISDANEVSDAFRARATEITRFKVFARVRPFIMEELAEMEGQERRSVVEMTENKTVILDPKEGWAPKAQFEFDASLWSIPPEHRIVHTFKDTRRSSYATQKDVYNLIARELVPHVFDGFNSCILTYGHTGSGKTYTMMGIYDPNASCGGEGEEGIIPRVSNDLFLILAEKQAAEKENNTQCRVTFRVEVSFVEIYKERVRDLLDPSLKNTRGNEKLQDARIRQDPYSGPFVEGVTKYQVENWGQCCLLLERGSQHRTTCATAVHNQSSRSHAIFQLTVIQETKTPPKDRYSRPVVRCQAGRINLVDLAGSERGGFQEYVKESAAINTSLLALRRVIDNLTERQNILMEQAKAEITGAFYQERNLPQVPFRDSVLTWLLSDSIGGNARTTMVATLSPLVKNYNDTLATLQWSSKARNLVTLVKVNDPQTLVTGNMASKAGELHNAVRIQRQNMDSLREALRHKQELAERLEKEARKMVQQTAWSVEAVRKLEQQRFASIVQRLLHRAVFLKKMKALNAQHNKKLGDLDAQERSTLEVQKERSQAVRKEAELRKALAAGKQQEEALRVELSRGAPADHFDELFATVQAQYDELQGKMGLKKTPAKSDAESLAQEQRARQRADEARQKAESAAERANAMEALIARSKEKGWEAKVEQDERDAVELKRQRDDLQRKLDELYTQKKELKSTALKSKKV